jgi:hypothetical protein
MASDLIYDVFLSYASTDSHEASQIYDSIISAGGTAFLSNKTLRAGDDFEEAIRDALHASAELWLLLSPNSLRSEWVISEWSAAWAVRKRIIPILFRCVPAEAPDRIRKLHCIDFHKYPDLIKDLFPGKVPASLTASKTERLEEARQISAMVDSAFFDNIHRKSLLPWRVLLEITLHANSVDDFVQRITGKTGETTLTGEVRGYLAKLPTCARSTQRRSSIAWS